ncbi:MAG TPA: hypothetical protein VFO10_04835 [Oligoflexus sp.]|nr:hypothetical protein [Oligoflexus sp.]HET9236549.1 hypothetical protein [Oligoflexus sp.]
MGTQVGNATPIDDVAAAASDARIEENASEAAAVDEASWTEAGGNDY